MVSPRGEWVYTIVEDLTLHCFSTSTESLEQTMQVRRLLCGECVQVYDKDVIGLIWERTHSLNGGRN